METCDDVCEEISTATKKLYRRKYQKKSARNEDLLWLINKILPSTKQAITYSQRVALSAFSDHELVPSSSGTKVHELVQVLWAASQEGSRELAKEETQDD